MGVYDGQTPYLDEQGQMSSFRKALRAIREYFANGEPPIDKHALVHLIMERLSHSHRLDAGGAVVLLMNNEEIRPAPGTAYTLITGPKLKDPSYID